MTKTVTISMSLSNNREQRNLCKQSDKRKVSKYQLFPLIFHFSDMGFRIDEVLL